MAFGTVCANACLHLLWQACAFGNPIGERAAEAVEGGILDLPAPCIVISLFAFFAENLSTGWPSPWCRAV
jgi:hypothetical protein